MSKYIKTKKVIDSLFDDVVKHYSSKGRYYHNMNHIYGVVSMWKSHKHLLEYVDEVFVAAIYHDIIYNPKRDDNEYQSSVYFINKVYPIIQKNGYKLSYLDSATVALFISATKHGGDFSKTMIKNSKDVRYLIDFDLETLGTRHQSTYDWYKEGVRKEYGMYSDEQYKIGRIKVLEHFLKSKKIFLTKEFKKIEKIARKNLQNEINSYICQ
jgi:predicted metal-dependent HD superfamily phosphohydrolase